MGSLDDICYKCGKQLHTFWMTWNEGTFGYPPNTTICESCTTQKEWDYVSEIKRKAYLRQINENDEQKTVEMFNGELD